MFLPAALHLSVDGRWGSFHLESRIYRENHGERLPGAESGRDRPVCTTGKCVPACVCVYELSLPVRVRVSLPNTCPPPLLLFSFFFSPSSPVMDASPCAFLSFLASAVPARAHELHCAVCVGGL